MIEDTSKNDGEQDEVAKLRREVADCVKGVRWNSDTKAIQLTRKHDAAETDWVDVVSFGPSRPSA